MNFALLLLQLCIFFSNYYEDYEVVLFKHLSSFLLPYTKSTMS